jgi:hypothetical protein
MDSSKKSFIFSAMLVSLLAFCLCFTSCGPSAREIAIRSAPSVEAVKGLEDKLIWLQGNAQSGGNYILEIDADENVECGAISSYCELSYKDKSNITITFRGIGANRTIRNTYAGLTASRDFTVGSGVTLILDDNITLQGRTSNFASVTISSGGTLIMNNGSTITGTTNSFNAASEKVKIDGAGVLVSAGGTFIMKGGTISGNTIRPRELAAQEIAAANMGTKFATGKELTQSDILLGGAGVLVSKEIKKTANPGPFTPKPAPSGTFIKTGGTITGYSSDPENGNVIKDEKGNVVNGFGHAILFSGEEPKIIDTTVGPEYKFNYSNGIFKEESNEEPKETTTQYDE